MIYAPIHAAPLPDLDFDALVLVLETMAHASRTDGDTHHSDADPFPAPDQVRKDFATVMASADAFVQSPAQTPTSHAQQIVLRQILAILREDARSMDAFIAIIGKATRATMALPEQSPAHAGLMQALLLLDLLMEHQIRWLGLHVAAETPQS